MASPLFQVLAGDGVRELRSSACALHRALDEATSLLTVFWRAALPGSGSGGEAVRGRCPLLAPPPVTALLLPPAGLQVLRSGRDPKGVSLGETSRHGGCFQ